MRFGFIGDLNATDAAHSCYQWLKIQPEVIKQMAKTTVHRKADTMQEVRKLEVALTEMSVNWDAVARLRLRWSMHSALN